MVLQKKLSNIILTKSNKCNFRSGLTKRIIPCLDVQDGRVVKGIKFLNLKDAGDPVETAKFYEKESADELIFLDITASFEKRKIILDVLRKTAENVFMPLTVGGGIKNLEDIRELLNAGADKISLNTAAVKSPELIKEAANKFGSQCIVVAIDAKRSHKSHPSGCRQFTSHKLKTNTQKQKVNNKKLKWEVYTHGGRTATGLDAVNWAKKAERLGAGEILLTSMDCDGTKNGYDLALTKKITGAVHIPVIASGGAGNKKDFYNVLTGSKASAALAASLFHYKELTIKEVKNFLKRKGVAIR